MIWAPDCFHDISLLLELLKTHFIQVLTGLQLHILLFYLHGLYVYMYIPIETFGGTELEDGMK